MGLIKGGFMRLTATGLYFITFVAGAIMTGATAWFIVSFRGSKRDLAIVGISAASLAYSFVAMTLTCCLAGITFFSLIGAIMDLFFFAAMIAVAVLNRDARNGCGANDGTTCRLYVATWVLAIISLIAYLINAVVSFMIRRGKKTPDHHHNDKLRY